MTPDRREASSSRRSGALIRTLVNAALLLACAGLLLLAVGPRLGGYRTLTMLTGSMRPALPVGTVLIDTPTRTSQLRTGQILTYRIPVDDHRVVSHRVVAVQHLPGGVTIVQTKGDANNGPDPWRARLTDAEVWTVRGSIPLLGSLLLWLRQPLLLTGLHYVLPGLLALWALAGLWLPSAARPAGRHARA